MSDRIVVRVDERMDPPDSARTARHAALRTVLWGAVAVTLAAGVVLGVWKWRDGSGGVNDGPGVVAINSRAVVTFDDKGLRVFPASVHAGIIEIAFADARKGRAGSEAQLFYEEQPKVGGDLIAGPGGHPRVLFCAHRYYLVVRVNGVVQARTPFDVTGKSPYCNAPSP